MRKILVAIKAESVETNTLDFACYLAELTSSSITGVFVDELEIEKVPVRRQVHGGSYVETVVASDMPGYNEHEVKVNENFNRFRNLCSNRGLRHTIHLERAVSRDELIIASRFADILIVDCDTSFEENYEGSPTHFCKYVLSHAECPVVMAPESFDSINEIIFPYDGGPGAMFAIRQFIYLFPRYKDIKITIVEAFEEDNDLIEEKERITDWIRIHFKNHAFEVLHGAPRFELFAYMIRRKNAFVVMGAYGRSKLSNILKPSRADLVVRGINLPVFIAHQ